MMEEKLIKGGEALSKAQKQEAALRKAETELRDRQEQEARMARELAEKEEANLQLEEHFSSLQEEVEVKTKKLKKLWTKFQSATREAQVCPSPFPLLPFPPPLLLTLIPCPLFLSPALCSPPPPSLRSPPPLYQQDLQEEFQAERSDMLDTIRQLTRTLKLKDLVIANFIPEEFAKGIERRSQWKEEEDCWVVAVSVWVPID